MYSEETRVYLAILTGCALLLMLVTVFVITIIRYQRKKVTLQQERITLEINALEKEKARIASDLHDDLGTSLSAIKIHLQLIKPSGEREISLIQKAETYIDETMLKLKEISFSMMPQVLVRNGLTKALQELIEMLTHSTDIKVNYQCNVDPVNGEIRIHIYRIVQEIMNNIIKHAKAKSVNLFINKIDNKISIHISDDGVGFNKAIISKDKKGLGLQNIMARIAVLHAAIYLNTEKGQGVDYLIEIPEAGYGNRH